MVQTDYVRVHVGGVVVDHYVLRQPKPVPDCIHRRTEHCYWVRPDVCRLSHDHALALIANYNRVIIPVCG